MRLKANIKAGGLILIFFFLLAACRGQETKNESQMAKKNKLARSFSPLAEQSEKKMTVADIDIRLTVEELQNLSQGGLEFELILNNDSTKDKEIFNPLDFMSITLQNEEGWPLQLPATGPNRHVINAPGPIDVVRPYQIPAVTSTAGEVSKVDYVKEEMIMLKAGAGYTYTILIDKLMKFDKTDPMARTTETEPLKKGKFKINIRLSILLAEKGTIHNTWESGEIEIELK